MERKTAFLFPGQGSQFVGMAILAEVTEAASDILGFDLKKAASESTERELADTKLAQPAIYAASLTALAASEGTPHVVAGHSLGEYAAMTAAGIITAETGFKAVKARGEIMSRAKVGGMAAVTGLPPDVIEEVCAGIDGVSPANYNSPQQTVIAGTEPALEQAEAALLSKGAKRVIRLNVSAAFHTELMGEAAEEFKQFAKTLTFNKPRCGFYSNVTGGFMTDFSDMPDYLAKHMRSPVRFADELRAMEADGIDTFKEVGPGKVLTGFVKKTIGGNFGT